MAEVLIKFRKGEDLTYSELCELPLVDRCRYVVEKYFRDTGFSAGEVAAKLNSLHPEPDSAHYSPMDVHAALVEFYGPPGHSS